MFLMAGRVKAEVTPKEGEKAEFKVKSPTATASVRGTGFEFDGHNLFVDHGAVQFESGIGVGIPKMVASGEFSTLSSAGTVTAPVAVATDTSDNRLQAAAAHTASDIEAGDNRQDIAKPISAEDRPGHTHVIVDWDD